MNQEGSKRGKENAVILLNNLLPVTLGNILGGAGLAIVYAKVNKE